ncbi:MAG TPA: 3-oxoacyl-ACP reductase family protein [Terracidiphilus sp.]|jgi:acetoacetyl-CoA reductase/3-oxoacyl-[acyl-carrier protein] reductase|nr:3-oxoacyl-ACP reductase family protein [Terracidiphilus sp.]
MATEVLVEPQLSPHRDLEGRVGLITGSSRGIGRAIARELAMRGATVAINYRTSFSCAEELRNDIRQAGGECELFQNDISDRMQARALVRDVLDCYRHIDILVNNAGITRDRSIRKMTDEDWAEVIETNLNSVFYCTTAVLPIMIEQKFGRIVNIASFSGQAGNFGQANYAASKGGIIAMTKVLALELARYNITANVIAPGFTETDMLSAVPADVQEQIKARIPMHRFGLPEETAKAVGFLVCDGDYITGQQINVNGGIYM